MRRFQTGLTDDGKVFQGETLKGDDTSSSQIQKVLAALIKSLDKRFADIDSTVLKSTKIADLKSWPLTYEE